MPSSAARYTLITPPWHTTATRSPGCSAMITVEPGHDPGPEHVRVPRHRSPPSGPRSSPASGRPCVSRSSSIGMYESAFASYSQSRSSIAISRPRAAASGAAVSRRAPQRGADHVVDALTREPVAEPRRLVVAARRELRIGRRAARLLGGDADRLGVADRRAAPSGRDQVEAEVLTELDERVVGSTTLIVVMPIARAGLRFTPRSSRNTQPSGGDVEALAHELVDPRVGLADPLDRRLDDGVEPEVRPAAQRAGRRVGPSCSSARRPAGLVAQTADRADHLGSGREADGDPLHEDRRRRRCRPPPRTRPRARRRTRRSVSSRALELCPRTPSSALAAITCRTKRSGSPASRSYTVERRRTATGTRRRRGRRSPLGTLIGAAR